MMLLTAVERPCSGASDVFLRLNIPTEHLLGFCFDGASNMSRWFSSVLMPLKEICSESWFVHCATNSLDLYLLQTTLKVNLIADSINFSGCGNP